MTDDASTIPVPDSQPDLEPGPDGHIRQAPYDDPDAPDTTDEVGRRAADVEQAAESPLDPDSPVRDSLAHTFDRQPGRNSPLP